MKPFKAWFALILIVLLACRISTDAPKSHSSQGEVLIDTRTPTPSPSSTFTPSVTPLPSATQTPRLTSSPDLPSDEPGEPLSDFLEVTDTITTTTVQTATFLFKDVIATRSGSIHQIAWAPDGGWIAAATSVGIYTFDAVSLARINALRVGEPFNSLRISPNIGMLVFGGPNGDIQWQGATHGWVWATFKAHSLGITELALSSPGNVLASGSDDRSVRVWNTSGVLNPNVEEYEPLHTWETTTRVTCVDIRWDGQIVAAGSQAVVMVWDSQNGEEITTLEGFTGWVNDLAFSPDGSSLAIVDSGNHLQIWDTATWQPTYDIELDQENQLSALAYSPNGDILAIGSRDGAVLLWDIMENIVNVLDHFPHKVTGLAFSPGGKQFISSYQNGTWRLWNLITTSPSETGKQYDEKE